MPLVGDVPVGKYKKVLLPRMGVLQEIPSITPGLRELEELWKNGELLDFEMLTLFILVYLHARSKKFTGLYPPAKDFKWKDLENEISEQSKKIETLPEPLLKLFYHTNNCSTVYEFLLKYRLLRIPGEVQEFLKFLPIYKYKIVISDRDLDPGEMLELQASGRRAITVSFINAYHGNLLHGRDALEFLLHDVSHAHSFYSEEYLTSEQVDFFRRILRYGKLFDPFKKIDGFPVKFNYLVSDMNSHPAHLMAYLKASLREARSSKKHLHPK